MAGLVHTAAGLQVELEALERRLDEGERRIEEAYRLAVDTTSWEEFWLELLHSYEQVYRRLAEVEGGDRCSTGT